VKLKTPLLTNLTNGKLVGEFSGYDCVTLQDIVTKKAKFLNPQIKSLPTNFK
jgi:hypothetical protein